MKSLYIYEGNVEKAKYTPIKLNQLSFYVSNYRENTSKLWDSEYENAFRMIRRTLRI